MAEPGAGEPDADDAGSETNADPSSVTPDEAGAAGDSPPQGPTHPAEPATPPDAQSAAASGGPGGEPQPGGGAAPSTPADEHDGHPVDGPKGPRPSYYAKVELDLEDDPPRLDFVRAEGADVPPPAMRALRQKIEDVARVVRIVFGDDPKALKEFFTELYITADSGLRGPNCDVDIGLENLDEVRSHIADSFPKVRQRLWTSNAQILIGALIVCVPVALALAASRAALEGLARAFPQMDPAVAFAISEAVLLVPLGVAIGLFVEFVLRVNDDLTYDQLAQINPGRWKPLARAFNTIVVAYVFAGLLGLGVVQAGLGPLKLGEFVDPNRPDLSIAVGFVTGFAFPYVRDLIQKARPGGGAKS